MQTTAAARPLVPSDIATRSVVPRSCFAALLAATRNVDPARVAGERWPTEAPVLQALLRAATDPATTTEPAWAGALAEGAVGQWLPTLTPESAAAALIPRGVRLRIRGGQPLSVPISTTPPSQAPWVGESSPIPATAFSFSTTDPMAARKMAVIVSMTRELARHSTAESVFNKLLQERAAYSLDAAYFSTDAGDDVVHAGLLNGLTPIAGSGDMVEDLSLLAAAVSGLGASGEVVFISSTARAAVLRLRSPVVNVEVFGSSALPDDRVIAVDPRALAHGFGPAPDISASEETVIHMDDAPANIGTGAGVASPAVSAFQVAMVVQRMILDVAFLSRRAGAVAYMDGIDWSPPGPPLAASATRRTK